MIEKTVHIQLNPRKKRCESKERKHPPQDPEDEIVVWKYTLKNKKGSAIKVSRCFMKKTLESQKSRYPYNDHKLVRIERDDYNFLSQVPFLEGYIRQGTLWLRERDDEKALELFRQNARKRIKELEKLIEGRKRFLEEAHIE